MKRSLLTIILAGFVPVLLPGQPTADGGDTEVFELSPYEVDGSGDVGYYSANAFSAYRINIPVAEVPFNITIVNEQFIDDIKATNLDEIIKYTPAVSQPFDDNNIQQGAQYTIRGIGTSRVKRNGFVRYYQVDTTNVSRVEIVKGPASALYGTAEPGGVINYVTKRPTTETTGELGLTVGTWDYWRWNASLSGPIGDKSLLYRVDLSYLDREGYRDWDYEKTGFASGLLEWRPTDRILLRADIEYTDKDFRPISRNLVWNPDAYARWNALPDDQKFDNGTLRSVPTDENGTRLWTAVADHFPLTINSAGPYAYNNTEVLVTTIEGQVKLTDNIDFRGVISDGSSEIDNLFASANRLRVTGDGVARSHRSRQFENDTFTMQGDLIGTFELGKTKHRVLVGVEYLEDDFSGQSYQQTGGSQLLYFSPTSAGILPVGADILDYRLDPQTRDMGLSEAVNENLGYYISYQMKAFDDRLVLLAGVREDESTSEDGDGNESRPEITQTSPQIGVNYRLTPSLVVFGNYSESFIPQGGFFRRFPADGVTEDDIIEEPREPQIGEGYEFGIKLDGLLDGKLSGTISWFQIDRLNVVAPLVIFPDGPSVPETAFRADRYIEGETSEGIDLSLVYSPMENWQIILGYANMDSVQNDPEAEASPYRDWLTRIPGVPDEQWSLWTKYAFTERLEGLAVGGGVIYMDDRRGGLTLDDYIILDSYYRVDLYASYKWEMGSGTASVSLNIENLFDETYFRPGPLVENPTNGKISFRYSF
ncbi:MAG: TonB-dependent siderophore receptor [Oceanipulchritudo sp.]